MKALTTLKQHKKSGFVVRRGSRGLERGPDRCRLRQLHFRGAMDLESLRAVSRAPLVVEKVLIWIKEALNVGYCRMTGDGLVYKS